MDDSYDALVAEAMAAPFEGWDFAWLDGRCAQPGPSWSYEDLARTALAGATSALDVDTGGGELLASLLPLPEHTVATEAWNRNVDVARRRLVPLGVEVRRSDTDTSRLPAADGEFDLVLNRHGGFDCAETCRVLAPGGRLLMQCVGTDNDTELNAALGAPPPNYGADLTTMIAQLEQAGFEITTVLDEWPEYAYFDIGAVVYHLRGVSWQIPDFDVARYDRRLRALDRRIRREGSFVAHDHRILIDARKTDGDH